MNHAAPDLAPFLAQNASGKIILHPALTRKERIRLLRRYADYLEAFGDLDNSQPISLNASPDGR
jgi:hypothetical protein